jgi:hypothetical protein
MKVKIIETKRSDYIMCVNGENQLFSTMDLLKDKIYNVESVEKDFYRIIDESGEDYLYDKDLFDIVEE